MKVFILALISFFVFLITHILVFHYFPIKRRFFTIICISIGSFLFNFLLYFTFFQNKGFLIFSEKDKLFSFVVGLIFYFALYYLYFNFIIIIDRSISVRMIMEIFLSGKEGLDKKKLKGIYSLEDKFRDELRDLIFLKRVRQDYDKFVNTSQGKTHARIIRFLREYLNLSKNR